MLKLMLELLRKFRYITLFLFRSVKIKPNASVSKNVRFEGKNKVSEHCIIRNSEIGFGTYLGGSCIIANTKIGKYCSIAYGVKVIIGSHPTNFVSTHPAFFSLLQQSGFTYTTTQSYEEIKYLNKLDKRCVEIGSDVWIGTDALIMSGVEIGNGAIIGAGALVTKNVNPYEIVAGVPAKKIGQRFDDKTIEILNNSGWWDKDEEWIKCNSEIFVDVKEFIEKVDAANV